MKLSATLILLLSFPATALAAEFGGAPADLAHSFWGYLSLALFTTAFCLVPLENKIHLRKSKPVIAAAGLIWLLLAIAYLGSGDTAAAGQALRGSLIEYAELFLFLLVAMTYINAMEERHVFQALRAWLVSRGYSLHAVFWITGALAFCISPLADNLTTALLMGAVVMAMAGANAKFVALACINIVVAANAGGAFSPFGDITTLMVWQKEKVGLVEFLALAAPAVVNWLLPAACMSLAVDRTPPKKVEDRVHMKFGAYTIIILFLLTIGTAVCFHSLLHLPAAAGMMLGLSYLGFYAYRIKRHEGRAESYDGILGAPADISYQPLRRIIERKRSLDAMIDQIPEPTFAVDKNHVVTHWNKACAELTGIPAEKMIGTRNQWQPFYPSKRATMADLIIDYKPEEVIAEHYKQGYRKNPYAEDAYDASGFFPNLGQSGRWITFTALPLKDRTGRVIGAVEVLQDFTAEKKEVAHFDIVKRIAQSEWDTLLFFYGVILCVGGLAQFGYLTSFSNFIYTHLGATLANSLIGLLSAVVDNIPAMYAVLTMSPEMSQGQWLLITLTTGVGGSLLSIGSAAGVALMGTARGRYTFMAHLKWTPVILAGYLAAILVHLWISAEIM